MSAVDKWVAICGSVPSLFVWFPVKYTVYNIWHMPLVASKGLYLLVFDFFFLEEEVGSIFYPLCNVNRVPSLLFLRRVSEESSQIEMTRVGVLELLGKMKEKSPGRWHSPEHS